MVVNQSKCLIGRNNLDGGEYLHYGRKRSRAPGDGWRVLGGAVTAFTHLLCVAHSRDPTAAPRNLTAALRTVVFRCVGVGSLCTILGVLAGDNVCPGAPPYV